MKIIRMPHAHRIWERLFYTQPHATFRVETIEPLLVSVPIVDGIAAEVKLGVAMDGDEPVLMLSDNGADLRRMEHSRDLHGPLARLAAAEQRISHERWAISAERARDREAREAAEYARGWVGRVADPWEAA